MWPWLNCYWQDAADWLLSFWRLCTVHCELSQLSQTPELALGRKLGGGHSNIVLTLGTIVVLCNNTRLARNADPMHASNYGTIPTYPLAQN